MDSTNAVTQRLFNCTPNTVPTVCRWVLYDLCSLLYCGETTAHENESSLQICFIKEDATSETKGNKFHISNGKSLFHLHPPKECTSNNNISIQYNYIIIAKLRNMNYY